MEIELSKKTTSVLKTVFNTEREIKLSSDIIVPDTMPDVESVLFCNAELMLEEKELQSNKLRLRGRAELCVIYSTDINSSPKSLQLSLPFEETVSSDSDESISFVCTRLRLSDIKTAALNSRKLSVELCIKLKLSFISNVALPRYEKPEESPEGVFYKTASRELVVLNNAAEKSFSIEGELELPEGKETELLFRKTEYCAENAEAVGSKLIVKCRAESVFLFCVDGRLMEKRKSTVFSQIFDNSERDTVPEYELAVLPVTNTQELEEGRLYFEQSGILQLKCLVKKSLEAVVDAYACKRDYELSLEPVSVCTALCRRTQTQSLKLKEAQLFEIRNVEYSRVLYGEIKQSEGLLRVPLLIDGIFSDNEGIPRSFRLRKNCEFELEEGFGEPEDIDFKLDCYGNGKELAINLDLSLNTKQELHEEIALLKKLSMDDREKPEAKSRVYLCRNNCELWELAKRYDSDEALIRMLNSDEKGELISDGLLLIPSI